MIDRADRPAFIAGIVVVGLALLMTAKGAWWSAKHIERLRPPQTGAAAPAFSLNTPDGKPIALGALRGQVVLLDFWATWCGACRKKMPQLERLHRELEQRGLRILAINVEGNAERTAAYLKQRKSPLTALVDDGTVARHYGVQVLPHLVLIDRQGKTVDVQVGQGGDTRLRKRIEVLLAAR